MVIFLKGSMICWDFLLFCVFFYNLNYGVLNWFIWVLIYLFCLEFKFCLLFLWLGSLGCL